MIRNFIDLMCATTVVATSNDVGFEETGHGRFRVVGVLKVATASKALDAGKQLFEEHLRVELDFGGVTATDSAGLAVLLEWATSAANQGVQISYRNIPKEILSLADICEVDRLLPRAEAPDETRAAS